MYNNKLRKTIEALNLKFEGLSELLENRNLLLKVLMGKEMREDFLLSERLQSLDEVGGYDVKAMNRNVDLSPVNEMMPPLNIGQVEDDDEGEVPFKEGGAVGINPVIDISAISLGSEPMGESHQSLEDSSAIVPLDKASKAIVQDFEVDKKFKKAFQSAMMLPSKAAAASLMDTMSKSPSAGDGTTIIKKNLSVLQSAFKLPTPEPTEDETKSESEQLDPEKLKKKREDWAEFEKEEKEKDKGKNAFELGFKILLTKAFSARANAKAGGAIAPSVATGDPLIPEPFPMMGYSGSMVGDGKTGNKGGFWSRLKSGAKKAFDMTPMGMGVKMLGAAKDKFQNVMQNDKVKGFLGGVGNFAKNALKYTPLGLAASAGSSIINRIRGGDQTNLNELTENVILEQDAKVQAEKDLAFNPIRQEARRPSRPSPSKSNSMEQGGAEAIPKIKYSPYFDEYTVTSQF